MRSWEVPPGKRTGADHLDILARTLFGEARSEALVGVVAVANVVMNRVRLGGWFGSSVASVCLKPYQFSCWSTAGWNERNLERMHGASLALPAFQECHVIARLAMVGTLRDVTGRATHYHTYAVKPRWASILRHTRVIGAHLFYTKETWQEEPEGDDYWDVPPLGEALDAKSLNAEFEKLINPKEEPEGDKT